MTISPSLTPSDVIITFHGILTTHIILEHLPLPLPLLPHHPYTPLSLYLPLPWSFVQ